MNFAFKEENMVSNYLGELKILTYNILADCYVRVPGQEWNAFSYCTDENLDWNRRSSLILENLLSSSADVICLQEVVFEQRNGKWDLPEWCDTLLRCGYIGIMQGLPQKEITKNAERNLRLVQKRTPTGVATFFKSNRFEQVTEPKSGSGSGMTLFLKSTSLFASIDLILAINNIHLIGDPSKVEHHEKQLDGAYKHFLSFQDKKNNLMMANTPNLTPYIFCDIICGDFNGDVHMSCNAGREGEEGGGRGTNFVTTWMAEKGFRRAATGCSWAGGGQMSRLDHIMYRFNPSVTLPLPVCAVSGTPTGSSKDNIDSIDSIDATGKEATVGHGVNRNVDLMSQLQNQDGLMVSVLNTYPCDDSVAISSLPLGLPNEVHPSDHIMVHVTFSFHA